jgi:hypothetical protein
MPSPIVTERPSVFSTLPNRIHVGIAPRRPVLPTGALLEAMLCLSAGACAIAGCLILVVALRI